jgi:hypothetical protein
MSWGKPVRIIGWRDAPQLWQNARLVELTSTSFATGVNPNTAPAEILATLPGVTADVAQRIIAQRQLQPIGNLRQLGDISGLPTPPFEEIIAILPSNAMRITQSAQGLAWSVQYHVTLTPRGDVTPWQVDYYSRVSTPQHSTDPAIATALPPRSLAPPENPPP